MFIDVISLNGSTVCLLYSKGIRFSLSKEKPLYVLKNQKLNVKYVIAHNYLRTVTYTYSNSVNKCGQ